jgi:1,2-diacylglycerol 3-alpha-glucosyltransferase
MQRLRVGLFTEIYRPVVNGVVTSVESLVRGLRDRGHEAFCVTPHLPGEDVREEGVIRVPSFPLPARTPYRLALPPLAYRRIETLLSRLDVVHLHSLFVIGWAGLRTARRHGLPVVLTYHTRLEAYAHYVPFEPHGARAAMTRLTRLVANRADAVIVPTEAMRDRLREIGVRTPVSVVPTGIDLVPFRRAAALRERRPAGDGVALRLLTVSRLAREKRVDLLLDALAVLPPAVSLVIAGDGPERAALEEQARRVGVADRVRFLGVVPREQISALYADADAFVFASTSETQGVVLVEALAAGLPIVAADSPATREVTGGAALLVPADAQALARAVTQLPHVGERLRNLAGSAAERFSIERQVEGTLAVYREVLASHAVA